ncbi:hypothetical protein BKP56_08065 [Marinilactibacillus sp. 15R]|nr:hypothetical protein BKP56_08065 [Marinilactibacillus sp. 15R]
MIINLDFFYGLVSSFPIWIQFLFYFILFYIFSFIYFCALRAVEIYLVFKSKDDYFNVMNDPLTMKKVILRSLFTAIGLLILVIMGYLQN